MDESIRQGRRMLRSSFRGAHFVSDQQRGIEVPLPEKPAAEVAERVALPEATDEVLTEANLAACIVNRRSRRRFADRPLSMGELSFLLYACQGIKRIIGGGQVVFRTVPSAGARHPLETYVAALKVEGLNPGLWRYRGSEHALVREREVEDLPGGLAELCLGQEFAAQAAVVLLWTAIPYRTEWRYRHLAHKPILLDAGHVCQNVYLAAEAMGAGACAIAAYDQEKADTLLGVDGEEEFVVYLAPVGKI